jgi:hypothetical protein
VGHQGDRPVGVAGLPPGVLGVDQYLMTAGLGVRGEPDETTPGLRAQPGVAQHEGLRAQRLDQQLGLAPGGRPGRSGQQQADLAGADPAEQCALLHHALEHPGRAVQQVGVAVRAGGLAVAGLLGLHPDDQDGAAAAPLGTVDLVDEPGPGEQAGGRVGLGQRVLHGLAPAGQPGDLAAGPLARRHVGDRAADAADRAVRVLDRLEPAVDVEPAAVGTHQTHGGASRDPGGPRLGDGAERLGVVVAVHVPGEDRPAQLVLLVGVPDHRSQQRRPDDLVTRGGVGEPGRSGPVVGGCPWFGKNGRRQDVLLVRRSHASSTSPSPQPYPATITTGHWADITGDVRVNVPTTRPKNRRTAVSRPIRVGNQPFG